MNRIVVLNGSPKGNDSITYQYVRYLQVVKPEVEVSTFHIGQTIQSLERHTEKLDEMANVIRQADLVLWVYPVYTFSVPYQVMQWIELMNSYGHADAFSGKWMSQILTSRHFYDHTAYRYIEEIGKDWKMHSIPGHLADMQDLLKPEGQARFEAYLEELDWEVGLEKPQEDVSSLMISLITDLREEDSELQKMIQTFRENTKAKIQVLNLNEISIKSGCLGCLNCALSGECVIKDDFQESLNTYVQNSDAIVYAGTMENHWFRSAWKKFDDRQFSNGHRMSIGGRPVGYLIAGAKETENNFFDVLKARAQVSHVYLCGIVSDQSEDAQEEVATLAKKMEWAMVRHPERPVNFQGVGGMRVFRDLIYESRGFMKEDHKFYRENDLYDFPHKKKSTIFQGYIIGWMMKIPAIRRKVLPSLKQTIIKPYDKILEERRVKNEK
jgi:multimeric flavodoxin WrbA/putative NADPH-quinone reductase